MDKILRCDPDSNGICSTLLPLLLFASIAVLDPQILVLSKFEREINDGDFGSFTSLPVVVVMSLISLPMLSSVYSCLIMLSFCS